MGEPRRRRSDGQQTVEKVVAVAVDELKSQGLAGFNINRVIDVSGVSRSSIYHHFGNREGLIAAAAIENSRLGHTEVFGGLHQLIDAASSGEEAFALIEYAIRAVGSTKQTAFRQSRVESFAAANHIPAIRQALHRHEIDMGRGFLGLLEHALERGLIAPRLPLLGITYMTSSIFVGRITAEVTDDPEALAAWTDTAVELVRHMLQPEPPRSSTT